MTHLWERDHPYYGPSGSYWANFYDQQPYNHTFDSWADFVDGDSMYNADIDMNFIYRWDWHDHRAEREESRTYYDSEDRLLADYPHDFTLELFWMMPRKGIMATSQIVVTPEDEPAVQEWLSKYWTYMKTLWQPFSEED